MLRMHDIVTKWGDLYLPGVELYADRALVLSGAAVVQDGPIDSYLDYLDSVGIGASEVIRVPGASPVRAALEDSALAEQIFRLARQHGGLQFFDVSSDEERLMKQLGLPCELAFNPPAKVAQCAGNKADLRRFGARLGRIDDFPEHYLVSGQLNEVFGAVGNLFNSSCDFVVLKVPALASGDGMLRVERERDWPEAVHEFLVGLNAEEVIVEAGYQHVPMSVQWELSAQGARMVCAADQLIKGTFSHAGNIVSSDRLLTVTDNDTSVMGRMSEPYVQALHEMGYRGVCGFDFMRTERDNRMYLLECNGRVTATTYAFGVARQLMDRLEDWAIVMSRITPRRDIKDFDKLAGELSGMLFDGWRGVLPFNVRLLGLAEPQCIVCCVAPAVHQAMQLLADCESRLS